MLSYISIKSLQGQTNFKRICLLPEWQTWISIQSCFMRGPWFPYQEPMLSSQPHSIQYTPCTSRVGSHRRKNSDLNWTVLKLKRVLSYLTIREIISQFHLISLDSKSVLPNSPVSKRFSPREETLLHYSFIVLLGLSM